MSSWCLGIDLGGTAIKIAAVDRHGNATETIESDTPAGGAEPVVTAMVEGARRLMSRLGITGDQLVGVGIGAPGPMDLAAGLVKCRGVR